MTNYEKREADCAAFMRAEYPKTVTPVVINGEALWWWRNCDGHWFTFETEEEAAADICQDMGVTEEELNRYAY